MTQPTDIERPEEAASERRTFRPTLTVDWDTYGKMLEDSDLTEEQKREFIETLWSIVVNFVDLGFGIHPLQQASEQELDLEKLLRDGGAEVINLDHSTNDSDARKLLAPGGDSGAGKADDHA